MIDIASSYLAAVTSLSALTQEAKRLETENTQLIAGTARQAKTIRQLNEQLSHKETEVQVEQYNVEFVKQQARKTRFKHRDEVKALKGQIEHLRKQVIEHEKRRVQAEQTANDYYRAYAGIRPKALPAVEFITQDEHRVRCQLGRRPTDFFMHSRTARFDILSMEFRYLDEHADDLQTAEHIARTAARAMTEELEAKIIETLMGKKMTKGERYQAEFERRAKQRF